LGPHPAAQWGLELAEPADRPRWLLAARLLSERDPEERLARAFARLESELGAGPGALLAAGPERAAAALAAEELRRAEALGVGLARMASGLQERHGGDLEALASDCMDLEELGGRLAGLAPGFGRAGVLRFLRPLREHWSAARETPLADTARAAALHWGLLAHGEDLEGEPAALRAACARALPERDPVDVEAALERLGARACRAGRPARCPLGEHCPAR